MLWEINVIGTGEIGNYMVEQSWRGSPCCRRGRRFLQESGSAEILCIVRSSRKNAVKGLIKSTWTSLEICWSNNSYHLKGPKEALKFTPHCREE